MSKCSKVFRARNFRSLRRTDRRFSTSGNRHGLMQSKIENRSASGGSKILDVDWEVLPPEEQGKRKALEPLFKWIAFVMDEIIRVPGTQFRFGLDPLIG